MSESFRVLAVDDDPGISELIAEFLPREDDRFIVETATSATGALDRFEQEVFDAIISDYQMPNIDGLDFLETVRDEFDSDMPFIIFTGKGREEVAIDALNLGADRYLQKGGDPTSQYSVLADAVRNEIEKHQTKEELRALNQELTAQNQQLEAYTERLETTEQRLRDEIEERKEREQELKRHKRLLDALFDFVPIHLFIKDREGRHLWVSSEFYDDPERWIGKRDTEVEYDVPEEFSEKAYEDDMRVIEQGEQIIDKETYDEARGRYFLTSKVPWRDEDGDVVGLLGYSFDITEQREREQRLQTIINNLPGIVYRCKQQPGWPMEMVRGRAEELTGYTADEIERGTVSWGNDIIHPADRNWVWEDVNRAMTDGESFELTYRIQTRSGEQRWVWEQGQPAPAKGDVTRVEGFITDITEEKEREKEIKDLKQRLELAIDGAHLGVWTWYRDTDVVDFNDNVAMMLGYHPDEIASHLEGWKAYIHPEDTHTFAAVLEEHLAGDTEYFDTEFRARTKASGWQWLRMIGQVSERDAGGKPTRVSGIVLDIDDRRTAEHELRQERDRLAALHKATTDIDSANTESEVYETVAEVADEILDFTIVTISIVEDDAFVLKARSLDGTGEAFEKVSLDTDTLAARSYKRGETIVADDLNDYDVTPADDGYASALTVPIGEYGVFQAVSREVDGFDDTDRELAELLVGHAKQALHRLEQAQSLREQREQLQRENERLDEFASYVSHDLRNPLNVASARLELAKEDCTSEHLDDIGQSLERMDRLITGMLSLAQVEERTVSDIETVHLAQLASRSWENVETASASIETENAPTVRADRDQLATVLENLFRNAVEHGGNDVTITVSELEDSTGFYIADDGPGIQSDEWDNIFSRGYSTKTKGTGLGLSIAAQIIDAHGWEITVAESASGGTRFEITTGK